MMKRRIGALALAAVTACSVLAGCGGSGESKEGAQTTAAAQGGRPDRGRRQQGDAGGFGRPGGSGIVSAEDQCGGYFQ